LYFVEDRAEHLVLGASVTVPFMSVTWCQMNLV